METGVQNECATPSAWHRVLHVQVSAVVVAPLHAFKHKFVTADTNYASSILKTAGVPAAPNPFGTCFYCHVLFDFDFAFSKFEKHASLYIYSKTDAIV